MPTIWVFDSVKNKHSLYCGEDCMKKLTSSIREHAKNVTNFEKNKLLQLTEKKN